MPEMLATDIGGLSGSHGVKDVGLMEELTPEEYKKEVEREKRERLERLLIAQCKQAEMPTPSHQFRGLYHIPGLKNKPFDLAWPEAKLLIEINGGEWSQGRHARGQGMIDDYNKWNTATLEGWKVLLFTGTQVKDETAITVVTRALHLFQKEDE